ncbi:uncharacterized protein EDB91DRAFT_1216740 [Suillus paluster]|uniref:uncharacterized protein n=1 Tax=Suillus paluster TaxID=48578 RepID=UPI001B861F99|nr:uncharacterized protein EDB91DRAFT_1216740 [Suillus paluster]KAG1751462.1 hypothetical protein EDB91DRAFT_1216740 [Suillus paluster]
MNQLLQTFLKVKRCFELFSVSLPDELIDDIIDAASYWAHTSITVNRTVHVHTVHGASIKPDMMYMRALPLAVYGAEGDFLSTGREACLSLVGYLQLNQFGHPPRVPNLIRFQLWSHDQGWVSDHRSHQGTYEGSYTWFDSSVERLNSTSYLTEVDEPSFDDLKKIIVANSQSTRYIVTWTNLDNVKESSPEAIAAETRGQGWRSYDGSFTHDLQVGDCITLRMRARFPGWRMDVVKAKITVYWAVWDIRTLAYACCLSSFIMYMGFRFKGFPDSTDQP